MILYSERTFDYWPDWWEGKQSQPSSILHLVLPCFCPCCSRAATALYCSCVLLPCLLLPCCSCAGLLGCWVAGLLGCWAAGLVLSTQYSVNTLYSLKCNLWAGKQGLSDKQIFTGAAGDVLLFTGNLMHRGTALPSSALQSHFATHSYAYPGAPPEGKLQTYFPPSQPQ